MTSQRTYVSNLKNDLQYSQTIDPPDGIAFWVDDSQPDPHMCKVNALSQVTMPHDLPFIQSDDDDNFCGLYMVVRKAGFHEDLLQPYILKWEGVSYNHCKFMHKSNTEGFHCDKKMK